MTDETDIDQAAPPQSIQDRIFAKFGGAPAQQTQEAAEPQADAESTEPELADIEWEGLTFKAPPKVKEALMRQDDYTRKTQEVAEARKSLDHLRELNQSGQLESVFNASVAAEAQELSVIDAYLQQASKLDWSQMTTEQMLRSKVEIDSIKERRDAIKSSIHDKRSKFDTELKAKMTELRKTARDLAAKKIGSYTEETEKVVAEYATSKGLSQQELENVLLDPRSAEILWEAAQFRKIKAGTSQAAERATKAPPALKPGAASERMPQNVAAKLNYNKAMKGAQTSGQKAQLIEQRLAGMFGGK